MTTMSGVVRVNQGSGYQTASGPGELNPGDLVMVNPGGLAQVSYSCGLTETVAPGAVYTVGDDARKCARASLANGPKPMLFHGSGPGGLTPLEIAAAIAAGVGGYFLVNNLINNDGPASP